MNEVKACIHSNEFIEQYKNYCPVVHTNNESKFKYLGKDEYLIELSNEYKSIRVLFGKCITFYFANWAKVFQYRSRRDYESFLAFLNDFLNNRICIIFIRYYEDYFFKDFSGKTDLSKDDCFQLVKKYLKEIDWYWKRVKRHGCVFEMVFWNNDLDKSFGFGKELFIGDQG